MKAVVHAQAGISIAACGQPNPPLPVVPSLTGVSLIEPVVDHLVSVVMLHQCHPVVHALAGVSGGDQV